MPSRLTRIGRGIVTIVLPIIALPFDRLGRSFGWVRCSKNEYAGEGRVQNFYHSRNIPGSTRDNVTHGDKIGLNVGKRAMDIDGLGMIR